MTIEKLNGKYTVNGKELKDMNEIERKFFNDFFIELKARELCEI